MRKKRPSDSAECCNNFLQKSQREQCSLDCDLVPAPPFAGDNVVIFEFDQGNSVKLCFLKNLKNGFVVAVPEEVFSMPYFVFSKTNQAMRVVDRKILGRLILVHLHYSDSQMLAFVDDVPRVCEDSFVSLPNGYSAKAKEARCLKYADGVEVAANAMNWLELEVILFCITRSFDSCVAGRMPSKKGLFPLLVDWSLDLRSYEDEYCYQAPKVKHYTFGAK